MRQQRIEEEAVTDAKEKEYQVLTALLLPATAVIASSIGCHALIYCCLRSESKS